MGVFYGWTDFSVVICSQVSNHTSQYRCSKCMSEFVGEEWAWFSAPYAMLQNENVSVQGSDLKIL
uniref:AlNc14C75G5056 protein n=1 Tax=Albugo laibachii Nc14 TaxID=890382 RepID=F0WEK6_9STRA|nr:AlNc14C75G5056 [Albugo laibachii Nc14]|eukprot:CCA19638.1 AlNc14C75G5056 [Albugo laibachii Nc14]